MSLKAFHLIFVSAAVILAFGFGAWLAKQFFSAGGVSHLLFALLSVAAGVGLITYEVYFIRKTKFMAAPESVAHEKHSTRGYLFVYLALLVGTLFTVWASFIHFGSREINVAVALVIACVKASLVAGYFMHLISEKKMIYSVLGFTAFFFLGLIFLTLFSMHDFPRFTITQ